MAIKEKTMPDMKPELHSVSAILVQKSFDSVLLSVKNDPKHKLKIPDHILAAERNKKKKNYCTERTTLICQFV